MPPAETTAQPPALHRRPFGFDIGHPSLFIGGLPARMRERHILELVEKISGQGTVCAIYRKSGYCFVDFVVEPDVEPNGDLAAKVAKELDGTFINSHQLGVRVQTLENHQESKRYIRARRRFRTRMRRVNRMAAGMEGDGDDYCEDGAPPALDDDSDREGVCHPDPHRHAPVDTTAAAPIPASIPVASPVVQIPSASPVPVGMTPMLPSCGALYSTPIALAPQMSAVQPLVMVGIPVHSMPVHSVPMPVLAPQLQP